MNAIISLQRQGFRAERPPSNVPLADQFSDGAAQYRCGARAGRVNATWPLVHVTFDDAALHLEGIPSYDVWIERSLVEHVDPIRWLWNRGIRFRSNGGRYDGLIVWCGSQLCTDLKELGWPA